ncbi:MAG: M1 family peptidase, partial [Ferruginibacter sp.]|nr:M1 family peptidase [Cytophagales bacterium]
MKPIACSFLLLIGQFAFAQTPETFSRQDSLRGSLTPLRTCYDVTYYDLNVRVDPARKRIEGHNVIHYRVVEDFRRMQLDLFANLRISRITQGKRILSFTREGNAVFVDTGELQPKGSQQSVTVHYAGNPRPAVNPPWDGGFSWKKDSTGKPWVAVSCEGVGASLWWPCKDHPSDEPDSVRIRCQVPSSLTCVANG